MKRTTLILALALCGCVRFHVEQTDTSTLNENGEEIRTIRTDIKGAAWFSSAQALAKLKVTQSDKSQSTGLDSLNQQGATNTLAALEALARIAEAVRPAP